MNDAPPPSTTWTAGDVVRSTLRYRHAALMDRVSVAHLDRELVALGHGPDPLEGERVEVVCRVSNQDNAGCMNWLGTALDLVFDPLGSVVGAVGNAARWDPDRVAILTDQRLLLRDPLTQLAVPYAEIEAVEVGSTTAAALIGVHSLRVRSRGEVTSVDLGSPLAPALLPTLRAAVELAASERLRPSAAPVLTCTDADPLGLLAATDALPVVDHRTATLLAVIEASYRAGTLDDDAARDLVRRTWLHGQTVVGGRGRRNGLWISCLRGAELLSFVSATVGAPEPMEPVQGHDAFRLSRDKRYGQAAAATLLLIGAGRLDFVLPRGDLRLLFHEANGPVAPWCGFELHAKVPLLGWERLGEWEPTTQVDLSDRLLRYEGWMLLRRAVLGASLDPEALAAPSSDAVLARARALTGQVDHKVFLKLRPAPPRPRVQRSPPRALPHPVAGDRGPTAPAFQPGPPYPWPLPVVAGVQAASGLLTTIAAPTVLFFGGSLVLMQLEIWLKLEPIIDEDIVIPLLLVVWMAICATQALVTGPARVVSALFLILPVRWPRGLVLGLGVLSAGVLLVGDLPGVLAAAVWLVAMRLAPMRAWFGPDEDLATAPVA